MKIFLTISLIIFFASMQSCKKKAITTSPDSSTNSDTTKKVHQIILPGNYYQKMSSSYKYTPDSIFTKIEGNNWVIKALFRSKHWIGGAPENYTYGISSYVELYFPGSQPPSSGTYTLQYDNTTIPTGNACVSFYEYHFTEGPLPSQPYFSDNVQGQIVVTNDGKITLEFINVPATYYTDSNLHMVTSGKIIYQL